MSAPVRDEELAALLDGTLEPDRAGELRERVRTDPRVAERLEALRRIDAALRSIPEPSVPGDWLARVVARARREEARAEERDAVSPGGDRGRGFAPTRSGPPRRASRRVVLAWALATGTAAAAGLALWLGTAPSGPEPEPIQVARPGAPAASPEARPAARPRETDSPRAVPPRDAPAIAPVRPEPPEAVDLEEVPPEEIVLVRTFAALDPEELDLVEHLDLLERWEAGSDRRRGS